MPRDPKRIDEILQAIRTAWEASPDLRLGQLILCAGFDNGSDLFYIEDDRMLELINKFHQEHVARKS